MKQSKGCLNRAPRPPSTDRSLELERRVQRRTQMTREAHELGARKERETMCVLGGTVSHAGLQVVVTMHRCHGDIQVRGVGC